jgi:hypothetical protein
MANLEIVWAYLKSECEKFGFPNTYYRMGNDVSSELGETAIDYRDGKWHVFLIERGCESDMATFNNQWDAVLYFFLRLMITSGSYTYPQVRLGDMPTV